MQAPIDLRGINVCVVGLGLIGGSFAKAIRELSPNRVFGIDRDEIVLKNAMSEGVIDNALFNQEEILNASDLVIIALYPKNSFDFIKDNMKSFKAGAILIDTAGVKSQIVYDVQNIIRTDLEFLGTHPMAGKAETGFKNSTKEIFIGSNYILTPTNKNKDATILFITAIACAIGCKNTIKISPDEHDEVIAYTSHLPHIVAVTLMNSKNCNNVNDFIGGGFRDSTRIAAINSELWCELLNDNSKNVIIIIEEFENNMRNLKESIINRDENRLVDMLNKAGRLRREIK